MRPGLSQIEAERRLRARGEQEPLPSSRSTASIVRANVATPFNVILVALGAVTLAFSDWRDALFLGIVVTNSAIGIWQELRAKRKLDELAALVSPRATVVRDGAESHVGVEEVVEGDLVRLAPGDQVVGDGLVVESIGLLVDESILTGESHPVPREAGDEVRSGSFAVEGAGAFVVGAVGADSYAFRLAGEARQFRHPRSPLEHAVNNLLYVLVAAMVPLGTLLIISLWKQEIGLGHAVDTAVAGMVTLIPEGLVLLMSVTYAAGAAQMARRGALAQQLNAIESLASVDTVCLDKTGTLTEPRLQVRRLEPAPGVAQPQLEEGLARFAASSATRNTTLDAIARAYPADGEQAAAAVPFASRRRWSGLELDGTRFVLGAPELFPLGPLEARAAAEQARGRRVVAIGTTSAQFPHDPDEGPPPLTPLGIAVLAEELRPEARETVAYFLAEGVELKVLSGDAPATAGSISQDAGIPLRIPPLDGSQLTPDDPVLVDAALAATVIGRISPENKRNIVDALRAEGRYVAMIGDGVNDVPALKAARLAIAQGSGAEMAKAIADVVLVDGDFASVPRMVMEGRKILRNIQRVTKLFVSKSVFAAFLILAIGVTPTEYPLLPRHLTIVGALTVGIPAFFLALAPSEGPWRTQNFLREVGRFSVPAGVAAGLGVVVSYLVTLNVIDAGLVEARTAATSTLILVGLYLVLALEATGGSRTRWVGALCAILLTIYAVVLALPGTREFFELTIPGPPTVLMILVGAALAIGFLWMTDERFVPGRQPA